MAKNYNVIEPVHPNAGLELAYRNKMHRMIEEMHRSIRYWIAAAYRAKPPEMALDDSPAAQLQEAINRLNRYWRKRFKDLAPELAAYFAQNVKDRSDSSLKAMLKKAGIAVTFRITPEVNDVLQATIHANVGLIRSIPEQHLTAVEGMVMRSVQTGRDLATLTSQLDDHYEITRKRAAFIALDQNNKATASITRVRQLEVGITQGIWLHSHAGKTPRPEHVSWDGKPYDITKGKWSVVDQEYVWPGTAINCLPGDSVIEFAAGCKKLWRRRYAGVLTEIVTKSSKSLRATPNHPILTNRGWISSQSIDVGDYVVSVPDKIVDTIKTNIDGNVAKFSEIFDATANYIAPVSERGIKFQFHGDVADGEVDTINIDSFLPNEVDASQCKQFVEFFFAKAEHIFVTAAGLDIDSALASACNRLFCSSERVVRGFSTLLPLLKRHLLHADDVCDGLISKLNVLFNETARDYPAIHSVFYGKSKNACAVDVFRGDQFVGKIFNVISRASTLQFDAPSADELGDSKSSESDFSGSFFDGKSLINENDRVIDVRRIDFDGHVFNIENEASWYSSQTCIVHNCRCVGKSIIPGLPRTYK